jgi:hypothetical protein
VREPTLKNANKLSSVSITKDNSNENEIFNAQPDLATNNPMILNEGDTSTFPQEKIKLGRLNVCGLKKGLVYPEFVKLIEDFHILCVQETKLDEFDKVELPGYHFYSKPRRARYTRRSGGLAFFVNNNINEHIEILQSKNEYVLVNNQKASICIFNV